MIFCIFSLTILILGLINAFLPKQFKTADLIIAAIVCCAIILIFPYGKDMGAYVMTFQRASSITDSFEFHMQRNIGFNVLMLLVKLFTDQYVVYRFVFNLISIGLISAVIFKYSENKVLSFGLLLTSGIFVVYYGSAVRQMMAMSLFIFGYFYLYLNKHMGFYLLDILLATSFHEIGFIGILPIFMDWFYQRFTNKRLFFVLTLLIALVGYGVFTFGMPWLYQVFGSDSVITHGLLYFKDGSFSLSGLLLRIILMGIYTGLFILVKPHDTNAMYRSIYLTLYGAFLIYLGFADFSLMSRATDYLGILELIFIPNLLYRLRVRYRGVFAIAIVCLYSVLMGVDVKEQSKLLQNSDWTRYPIVAIFDHEMTQQMMEGDYE